MAVAEQELEQIGFQSRLPSRSRVRRADNSGPLKGFNDPESQQYQPLSPSPLTTAETVTNEQATSQAFRAGTVAAQRREAQEQQEQISNEQRTSDERVRQYKAIQQGQKAKDIPILAPSSTQDLMEKVYKRSWQIAQETVEDLVIPTFFLLDLVLIPLYFVRWVGGNMMGGLFTISREIPYLPGTVPGQKINIKLIPGYSLADPLDYVRHFKFLLLVFLPIAILGFVVLLLYFVFNWANITDPTVRGIWGIFINLLPKI